MTSELNISIWRSLAKQYGTPHSGTPNPGQKSLVFSESIAQR